MANCLIIRKGTAIEGTATPSQVLSGATFQSANSDDLQTGTLSLTGNASANDVLSGKTFYNTDAQSKQTGTLSLTGNASANDVLSGKTFYNTNAQSKQTGTLSFKAEKLAESQSSSSVTLQKDYFAIVVTISVDGKRSSAGLPSINVNGLTLLANAGTGNYGANSYIGADNDYITQTYIYGSASSGHTISWGSASNGWGHILVLGITR